MGNSILIVSICMGKSIRIKRVKMQLLVHTDSLVDYSLTKFMIICLWHGLYTNLTQHLFNITESSIDEPH